MKINFNTPLLDLDGQPIKRDDKPTENQTVGQLVARMLISSTTGDALKFLEWARKMHNGEVIDLDVSDQETLKAEIKNSTYLTNLTKGQALELLVKTKD